MIDSTSQAMRLVSQYGERVALDIATARATSGDDYWRDVASEIENITLALTAC